MSTLGAAARLGRSVRELTTRQCWKHLASTPVGRLVFTDGSNRPIALPVNHAVDDETIVFRSIPGSKLATAVQQRAVSYQADRFDDHLHTGWSVLAKGRAELASDQDDLESHLGGRLQPWAPGRAETLWVRVSVEEITGLELMPDE